MLLCVLSFCCLALFCFFLLLPDCPNGGLNWKHKGSSRFWRELWQWSENIWSGKNARFFTIPASGFHKISRPLSGILPLWKKLLQSGFPGRVTVLPEKQFPISWSGERFKALYSRIKIRIEKFNSPLSILPTVRSWRSAFSDNCSCVIRNASR